MIIPYPVITAPEPEGQIRELKAYLFALADQMNYILEELQRRDTLVQPE